MNFLKSRITLRNDTVRAWENSKKKLLAGEAVLGRIEGSDDFELRVGTGAKAWSELSGPNVVIPAEKVRGLGSISSELGACISGKVFVSDPASGFSGYTDLSVLKMGRDEYAGLVSRGLTLPNCLYVVSSDEGSMYGAQLRDVGEPELSSDAATKGYVDFAAEGLGGSLSTKADLSGDVCFNAVKADVISALTTAQTNDLSVTNVYGRLLGRGLRFHNAYTKKYSHLLPDGSPVATMAKVSASYQPLSAVKEYTNVRLNGAEVRELSVRTVSRKEFADLVLNGKTLSNEVYQVSSDVVDVFGQRIVCLADGQDSWDAATYGQLSAAENMIRKKAEISGQAFTGAVQAPNLSAGSLSATRARISTLSVSQIYGTYRNSAVCFRFHGRDGGSFLSVDGSPVMTMNRTVRQFAQLSGRNSLSGDVDVLYGKNALVRFERDGFVRLSGQDNGINFSKGTFNQFETGSYMALDGGFDQIRADAFDPKLSVGLGTVLDLKSNITRAVIAINDEVTLSADRITVVDGSAIQAISVSIPQTTGDEMRLCELLITDVSADNAVALTHPEECLLGNGADSIEAGANHFIYAEYARGRWLVTKTVFT